MYTGQLNRSPAVRRLASALWTVAALGLIAGCGGKDEPEPSAQAKPQTMVPAGDDSDTLTAGADTMAAGIAVQETGTFAGEGVLKASAPAETTSPASTPSGTRSSESAVGSPFNRSVEAGGTGAFSLQLGSFRSEANARAQVLRIQELGYSPTVEVASLAGQTYHRVVLRGLADRSEAERLGEHVRSELGITYLIRQK